VNDIYGGVVKMSHSRRCGIYASMLQKRHSVANMSLKYAYFMVYWSCISAFM